MHERLKDIMIEVTKNFVVSLKTIRSLFESWVVGNALSVTTNLDSDDRHG